MGCAILDASAQVGCESRNKRKLLLAVVKPSEQLADFRPNSSQLLVVHRRKPSKNFLAPRCQLNKNAPAIFRRGRANNQFFRSQTVNQTHRAMMAKLQSLRQFAHSRFVAAGKPLYRKQRLVLLRRDARGARRFIAKVNEPAQRVTKRRQRLKLRLVESPRGCRRSRAFILHTGTHSCLTYIVNTI